MKQLLFILMLSTSAIAQTHQIPFPDSNAVWVQHKSKMYPPGQGPDEFCEYIIYTYDRSFDNGYTYYNVYAEPHTQGENYLFEWVWMGWPMGQHIGRFRVDSLKVYYQRIQHGSVSCWDGLSYTGPAYTGYSYDVNGVYDEFLMYDFGLQVGDTFHLTTSDSIALISIDSVLIEGDFYRRFNFDPLTTVVGGSYYWIEGIGSKFGFFPYFYSFEQGLSFDCFHEDPDSSFLQPLFSYDHGNSGCKFVSIPEIEPIVPKELVRITDLMGRESKDIPNTTLIYIYSDGTTEKVYRLE